ncbi:MAG: integrase, partial [Clostridiales bacterium]|nr:integrase [Clostridiales bacterium]
MKTNNYYVKRNISDLEKIEELLNELPSFCADYFLGIESRTSSQTRLKYAYDLRIFFDFLAQKKYRGVSIQEMSLQHLEGINHHDIELFLSYLSHYRFRDKYLSCDERAKARKLSAVRAMFKYFFNKGMIEVDNSAKVPTPKLHDKEIIRLETSFASKR